MSTTILQAPCDPSWQAGIERLPGKAEGRSAGTAFGPIVFVATVAHDRDADFRSQTRDVFRRLEEQLQALGSGKAAILSATVYLADMAAKPDFDADWIEWIGPNRQHWPQRVCVGVSLTGNTLVEIAVVAARAAALMDVSNVERN